MKKRIRHNGIIMCCSALIILIFPGWFLRKGTPVYLDQAAEICGMALIFLGQIFRISARGFKAEHSRDGEVLLQSGPYALVRNPMYLGITLIGLGIVLMLFKLWVLCIFLLFFLLRYILLIFQEEKKLQSFFPQDYPQYQKLTPRIFPSLGMLLGKEMSEYLPLRLSWLKKEIGPILAVLLVALGLGAWKDIKNGGINVYLNRAAAILVIAILFMWLAIYLTRGTGNNLKMHDSDKS